MDKIIVNMESDQQCAGTTITLIKNLMDIIQDNLDEKHRIEEVFDESSEGDITNILESNDDDNILPVEMSPAKIITSNDIYMNVGGKKFLLGETLISHFKINLSKLQTEKTDKTTYFLDRDYCYFQQIINYLKKYGREALEENKSNFSKNMLQELCHYGFISPDHYPEKIIIMSKGIRKYNDTVKIVVDGVPFETLKSTIMGSKFILDKMKMYRTNSFTITNVNANIFRCVLNFLRNGALFTENKKIVDALKYYKIDYEVVNKRPSVKGTPVSYYYPNYPETIKTQQNLSINFINNSNESMIDDNDRYSPSANNRVSYASENMNCIFTESKLQYGGDIVFNITPTHGDCLEDIIVCLDLPIIGDTEMSYKSDIEHKIIQEATLVHYSGGKKTILCRTSSEVMYLHPIIYTNNGDEYMAIKKKLVEILYCDNFVSAYRITLPLFMILEPNNHVPILKASSTGAIYLHVKVAPLEELTTGTGIQPLLNAFLRCNFINTPYTVPTNTNGKISMMAINKELVKVQSMYMYNIPHTIHIPIERGNNDFFNVTYISLSRLGNIKDFYCIICTTHEDFSRPDKYLDILIEIEVVQILNDNSMVSYTKVDSTMLTEYNPLKRLGHTLRKGMYYHTFSTTPLSSRINGGFCGSNHALAIRTKKMDGIIILVVNETNIVRL
jgi:hypothetical protein